MESIKVPINTIKVSPDNPRVIKGDKFIKLKKSIKEFPQMMDLRPIIVDETNTVLGGNMRLQACIELGLKKVSIIQINNFTEQQKKEFIIKDNASFGEWDWDVLANEWEVQDLSEWGLDIPGAYFDDAVEPEFDKDELDKNLDTYINNKVKQITLYFDSEQYEYALKKLEEVGESENIDSNTDVVLFLLETYK
jgi:hypothetical protein